MLKILPILSREYVENKVLDLTKDQAIEWVRSILNSCVDQLSEHLLKGSQIDTRLKTTIFWYFREVLRFGSHSRVSMRYDRVLLENITEALAFASVVDLQLIKSKYLPSIVYLSNLLKTVVSVHNYYSENFSPKKNNTILIGEYNKSLQNLHKELRYKNIC